MLFNTQPNILSFAGNPMRYKIDVSEGGGGTPMGMSVNTLTFTDIDTAADHVLSVTLLGQPVTFTLKAVPDGPTELPAAETGMSVLTWATNIFERLERNALLLSNYAITFDTELLVITLRALEGGPLYDITEIDNTITGMALATTIGGTAGTTGAEGVVLWVLDKNNIIIGEDYKPLNSTNFVDFDIAEYLEVALLAITHPLYHLSPGSQFLYSFNPDFIFKHKVGVAFRVGGVTQTMLYNSWHFAITGGLNRVALNYWNTISGGYWANSTNKLRFMSWYPGTKKTFRDAPESLYFTLQSSYTKVRLKVIYTCVDGTQGTFQAYEFSSPTQYQVLECTVGYSSLSLQAVAGKVVSSWVVWLTNQSDVAISQERTFEIDENYYEFKRSFVFKNSFGVFEMAVFKGKGEEKEDYDRENISLITDEVETSWNSPDRHSSLLKRKTFKVNTGWISNSIYSYLSEFLGSMEIYEIVAGVPYRIRIISKTTKPVRPDGEYNYYLEIDFERAWQDRFYSTL